MVRSAATRFLPGEVDVYLLGRQRPPVLADLEGFDAAYVPTGFAVAGDHRLAETVRCGGVPSLLPVLQPGQTLRVSRRNLLCVAAVVGQPLVDLRHMAVQHPGLVRHYRIDRDNDIRREGSG